MSDDRFDRHRRLLCAVAARGFDAAAGGPAGSATLLEAAPAARLLIGDDSSLFEDLAAGFERLGHAGGSEGAAPLAFDDDAARLRALEQGLALHLHLAAFNRHYELMPASIWSACEARLPAAVDAARIIERYSESPPPRDATHLVLWLALCVLEQAVTLQRDVDVEWVDAVVHQTLTADLRPAGLHALANLALLRRNRTWARRVEAIALAASQPGSAAAPGPPWALFAFLWSPQTSAHAGRHIEDLAQRDEAPDLLSAMLLADAAEALRSFAAGEG
jgi:hypothetical protein